MTKPLSGGKTRSIADTTCQSRASRTALSLVLLAAATESVSTAPVVDTPRHGPTTDGAVLSTVKPARRRDWSRVSRGAQRRPVALNWTALSACESGGSPQAIDPSGTYFGLYQFDIQTWRSIGGAGNPADASPAEQTYRAELLYAQRGAAPWPVCGWRLAS